METSPTYYRVAYTTPDSLFMGSMTLEELLASHDDTNVLTSLLRDSASTGKVFEVERLGSRQDLSQRVAFILATADLGLSEEQLKAAAEVVSVAFGGIPCTGAPKISIQETPRVIDETRP